VKGRILALGLLVLAVPPWGELAAAPPSADTAQIEAAARQGSVRALLELARIRTNLRDGAGAVEALRRALELAPNSEEVLSAYSRLSLTLRTPVPAILSLEPLVRMHPTVPEYPYLLGVAWLQAGDMAAAGEMLGRAERLRAAVATAPGGGSPSRATILVALGIALNKQKRFAEARQALEKSLRLEPDNVEGLAAVAEAQEGLGELAAAERHARRALARADAHATANLVVGMILMKQERYAEARAALEKAIAAEPESPKAHYQLSLACARLGDREASTRHVELYRQALRDVDERLRALRRQVDPAEGGSSP
jgi:tetratricopeptide (TPR) repeat protein